MWEFKVNNTFGATAFTSYGAFWMSFAGYVHIILPQIKQIGNVKKATGLFLLAWFIFTIIMNVAALKISKFLFILFTTLNITFLLLIIGNLANLNLIINIGGWFGIITAFIAWYGCAAIVINSTFKKPLLPLGVYA
jgi:succinate-acetate transporter protein